MRGTISGQCTPCRKARKQKYHQIGKPRRDADKRAAYDAYGGAVCKCCGEDTLVFLSIDHIDGGGNQHKKVIHGQLYSWLRTNNYPSGFQVLCHNCNQAKHINGGTCPHQVPKFGMEWGFQ